MVNKTRRSKRKQVVLVKATPASKKEKDITRLGRLLRNLGGLGGAAVSNMLGMGPVGAQTGYSLGAALSRWLGSGDYTVACNSLVPGSSMKASASIPDMHKAGQSIIVRHREFVQTINSATTFTVQASLSINPGMKQTFPWLSSIAANYQEYEIKGMVFHYVPTSGQYSTSGTALGSVMIQTAYRSTDTAPATKYECLNEYWASEVVPSETLAHPIECKQSETVLGSRFIRDGAVTEDTMFYDYGTTFVSTTGQASAGQALGDLFVVYEVELRKPRLYASVGRTVTTLRATTTTGTASQPYLGAANAFSSFLGTVAVSSPSSNLTRLTLAAGNVGSYAVCASIRGTGLAWSGTPSISGTNISVLFNGSEGAGTTTPTVATAATRCICIFGFSIVDPTLASIVDLNGLTLTITTLVQNDYYVTATDADSGSVF